MSNYQPKVSKMVKKLKENTTTGLVLLAVSFQLIFPSNTLAVQAAELPKSILEPEMVLRADQGLASLRETVSLITPIREHKVLATYNITVTAYSSSVDQTDSTPCITANGFDLCKNNEENVIAANFLPFGTKVRIPEYFGDRIFTVQDRMNARYYYRADIWMKTRPAAIAWGAKYVTIEVVE